MTKVFSGDYIVAAGTVETTHDSTGYGMDPSSDGVTPTRLLDYGEVHVVGSGDFDNTTGVEGGNGGAVAGSVVWIEHGGLFDVELSGDEATAIGYYGQQFCPDVRNDGTFQVSASDKAVGVHVGDDRSAFTLTNTGSLSVTAGASATGVQFDWTGIVHNSGSLTVHGDDSAVAIMGKGEGIDLVNSGSIVCSTDSSSGVAIEIGHQNGFAESVDNSGTIRAHVALSVTELEAGPQPGAVVDNTGRIYGLVELGQGDDRLTNPGTIIGDVHLGDGADLYEGLTGRTSGIVYGGAGADTLAGAGTADRLDGDGASPAASDGADRISGAGGDDLIMGGGGADALNGNKGDDTLVGGGGADLLRGSAGHDRFVFSALSDVAAASPDTIAHIQAADLIDLSGIDADTTKAGDQAFTLVHAFTGHAGQAELTWDAAAKQTLLLLDVDGDGQADGAIDLQGDHVKFGGFVL